MRTEAEQVLQKALALDPDDRVEVAEALIVSLGDERTAEIEAAWAEEIKRRLESIEKGEVQLVPWDEMMRSMRERLNAITSA
jgi:putative addiction module component (TIGR02574 family)